MTVKKSLVIVTPQLPSERATHAGGAVLHQRLTALAERCEIVIVAPGTQSNRQILEAGDVAARTILVDPDYRPVGWRATPRIAPALAGRLDIFADTIRGGLRNSSPELSEVLAGADIVEIHWGEYLPLARQIRQLAPGAVIGAYLHDVLSSVRLARSRNPKVRGLERAVYRLSRPAARLRERRALDQCDVLFVLKPSDIPLVATGSGRSEIVVAHPHIPFPPTIPGPGEDPVVLFVSALWREENALGATWFIERVWPLVLARVPVARMRLVGPGISEELDALAASMPRVSAPGFVDDLVAEHAAARVVIAPLWDPSGLKIKVVHAMLLGLPVVATSAAAAGLAEAPEDALAGVYDDPEGFAMAVVEMLLDNERAATVGHAAAAWARGVFDARSDAEAAMTAYGRAGAALLARKGTPS